ncbi:RsmB/NOP family class I SAM-dependent RNA methyltransferase [Ruegeria profundi]|uniref:RsmB/NOP family class I SAM-dependent RNA methyltransferase n=1 Tax=Ruegeria profundi TaxID=1685378 RepID=UPI001CD72A91|nr:RsmB/NOP family class I SAM-dependent RNA methyltransferase [Ruegeria profundi]MCA0929523.1 methyltransferase domain-containing protein [Ruegeria profundi]
MSDNATAARRSAIYLLDQILGEGRLLPECLAAGALDRLAPDDRARAQRLTLQTLRGLERADRLLDNHLNRTPALTVQNALRLGAVELCLGEAAHGVVNSMVEIVGRSRKHGRLKGLVNAVLRKVADEGPEAWPKMRVPRLPEWLREPLIAAWGADAVAEMERAHFTGAPLDITLKPGATGPGEALPTGSLRVHDAGQVSTLPGFANGDWWVQDAAAALPVRVLAPRAGESVLDLCAAPGGKALQLAAAGATVTALDISESRLERVRENLKRTNLQANVIAGDALEHQGQYDAILLDAPCSATGTIRRHPDLPFAKDGSEFAGLIALQTQMLAHAWTLLKPGGRLVYCTCSLLPDEGEVQIEEALDQNPDMTVDRDALKIAGVDQEWITPEGGLRLRPDYWADLGGMDGFYIACLNKSA